jgi:hypothetical protein
MTEAGLIEFLQEYWPLLVPLFIIQYGLVIAAIIDLSRQETTRGPKMLWVFVIMLVNFIGPILYFVIGRDEG